MAVKKGTSGHNFIEGTPEGDLILGYAGNDNLLGYGGSDTIYGGDNTDHLFGGEGGDTLYGEYGDDYLYGDLGASLANSGGDYIDGGYGQDFIDGGPEADFLVGGPNADVFYFKANDSDPLHPDTIWDFQASNLFTFSYDKIAVDGPSGTATNYFETMIAYDGGYNLAKGFANNYVSEGARYVFITDSVNGYFFSDANHDGTIENGILLDYLNDLNDFSYKNVFSLADSPL
jgi:Ca2+-binding RTX toxin-like protein